MVLGGIAMLVYPGGTARDPTTRGYSLFQNFLSDLGSTVTYGGQSNSIGALLFAASLGILVVALFACLVSLIQLYADSIARRLAWVAAGFGAVVCAAFIGVAATPENRFLPLHVEFTFLAFRTFPAVTLLFAVATMRERRFSRRAAAAWIALTCVLVAYVAVLQWGPRIATDRGLSFQATAQKVVALTVLMIMGYLSYEAGRVAGAVSTTG